MKKVTIYRILGFLILSVGIQITLFELWGRYKGVADPVVRLPENELFDPRLMRLNSIKKLEAYCDSVYGSSEIRDSALYAGIVGKTLRYRFYHGFSHYRLGQNFIGWVLAPYIHENLSAIVLPNDILKHPNGGCSQQAIVGMELFRYKGFTVRKVGFFDPIIQGGHFCFEVKYGGKWHFFDPDKEPDLNIMERYGRPSIAELVANRPLLDSLYYQQDSTASKGYLLHYTHGPENTFPAKNARIYQLGTKFLSWTLPFWLLIGLWWLRNKRRKWLGKRRLEKEAGVE